MLGHCNHCVFSVCEPHTPICLLCVCVCVRAFFTILFCKRSFRLPIYSDPIRAKRCAQHKMPVVVIPENAHSHFQFNKPHAARRKDPIPSPVPFHSIPQTLALAQSRSAQKQVPFDTRANDAQDSPDFLTLFVSSRTKYCTYYMTHAFCGAETIDMVVALSFCCWRWWCCFCWRSAWRSIPLIMVIVFAESVCFRKMRTLRFSVESNRPRKKGP